MAKTGRMKILYSGTFSILYHNPQNLTISYPIHLGLMLCSPWEKDLQNISFPKCLLNKKSLGIFPGGSVAKTLHSQGRGPGSDPWSGNYIPHATTKSSNAATGKDPACCKE